MGMKTVAIIGALDEEVALIAKSLTHVTHTAKGSLDIVSGTVDSFGSDVIKVAATVGGMGLVNAAATTQLLIDEIAPDAVIFSGIAGNLNTHLYINDVVLGGTLRYLDGSLPQSDADSDWWNMVYRWTDCPVLAGLDLGDYASDAVQSESGSSQELMSRYYIGIRGAWNKDSAGLLEGGEELWNKLTAGAVSTATAEG